MKQQKPNTRPEQNSTAPQQQNDRAEARPEEEKFDLEPRPTTAYLKRFTGADSEDQARTISDKRLNRVQRQLMAASIAKRRGNQHLQRVVDHIQRENGDQETIDQIKETLDSWWVGPLAEYKLQELWRSFGSYLPDVVNNSNDNFELFKKSHHRGAELDDLDLIQAYQSKFKLDVKATAMHYLRANEEHILKELERIGLPEGQCMPMSEDIQARMAELKEKATHVQQLQQEQAKLRQYHVGYNEFQLYDDFGKPLERQEIPANFHPNSRPEKPPKASDNWPSWELVNSRHQEAAAAIAKFAADYPAIFALIQDDRLEEFVSETNPEEAQFLLGDRLKAVLENIRKSRSAILTDDLDYRDLKPIHQQLFKGATPGSPRLDWTQNLPKWAGQQDVKDHEDTEFWIALGLGTAAAVAFIVAEIATFGSATFFLAAGLGLAAGGVQAGMSWEKYDDLSTAADATVRQDMAIVNKQQADAALTQAVLDSIFILFDVFPLAKAATTGARVLGEAGQAGMKAAMKPSLKAAKMLPDEQIRPLIQQSIAERGLAATREATGMSDDQLIRVLGAGSPEAQSIKALAEGGLKGGGKALEEIPTLAEKLATGAITRETADEVVQTAIQQHGAKKVIMTAGGWENLGAILGNGTRASKILKQWRDSLFEELKRYVDNTLRAADEEGEALIKKTGTDAFNSDLDISMLGKNAAKNREEAMSWLKGRLGISESKDLSKLLDMDLFTDPRRMHLYEELPDAVRAEVVKKAAARERELIFQRRLSLAKKAGDEQQIRMISEQMDTLGIPKTPFIELSADQVRSLARQIDSLHADYLKATSAADKARIADKIAEYQAVINATEKGGYFSGGGVRKFVSDRDAFPGYGAANASMDPALIFNAMADQLPKLDKQALALRKLIPGSADPADIAKALKGFSKYGDRIRETIEMISMKADFEEFRDVIKYINADEFDELASYLDDLLARARKDPLEHGDALLNELQEDAVFLVDDAMKYLDNLEQGLDQMMLRLNTIAGIEGAQQAMLWRQSVIKAYSMVLAMRDDMLEALIRFKSNVKADPSGVLAAVGTGAGRSIVHRPDDE